MKTSKKEFWLNFLVEPEKISHSQEEEDLDLISTYACAETHLLLNLNCFNKSIKLLHEVFIPVVEDQVL
mgnify:CR=1 FL=1